MDDWKWLWQGAAFEIVWKFGVMTVVTVALTWAKSKWPKYGQHAPTFLVIMASIAVIWFSSTGTPLLESRTTASNIDSRIKDWSDKFGTSLARREDANAIFVFDVTVPNQNHVTVERLRRRAQYLVFQGSVTVATEHQMAMQKLSEEEREKVVETLTAELSKAGVGYTMDGDGGVLKSVVLATSVPITSNLTEDIFAANLDRIDNAIQMTRADIRLALAHTSPPH